MDAESDEMYRMEDKTSSLLSTWDRDDNVQIEFVSRREIPFENFRHRADMISEDANDELCSQSAAV